MQFSIPHIFKERRLCYLNGNLTNAIHTPPLCPYYTARGAPLQEAKSRLFVPRHGTNKACLQYPTQEHIILWKAN